MIKTAMILLCLFAATLFAQDDSRPWERLGLSLTEWKLIQDDKMPMSKVEQLLKDGIGISEYFTHPWEKLGMTESKWIAKRRKGLTSYDIEQQVLLQTDDSTMQPTPKESISFVRYDHSHEAREQFSALCLPGYRQCRRDHKVRGRIMLSLGIGSLAGCAAWSIADRQFISLPLFAILVPDMIWSFIDHKVYMNRKSTI